MMLPGGAQPVEALRGLGLVTLALIMGANYVPALRARRRRIGVFVLVLYFGLGAAFLVWGYLL